MRKLIDSVFTTESDALVPAFTLGVLVPGGIRPVLLDTGSLEPVFRSSPIVDFALHEIQSLKPDYRNHDFWHILTFWAQCLESEYQIADYEFTNLNDRLSDKPEYLEIRFGTESVMIRNLGRVAKFTYSDSESDVVIRLDIDLNLIRLRDRFITKFGYNRWNQVYDSGLDRDVDLSQLNKTEFNFWYSLSAILEKQHLPSIHWVPESDSESVL